MTEISEAKPIAMSKWILLLFIFLSTCYAEDSMKQSPYGSWRSPITAQKIATGMIRFSEVTLYEKKLYWLEARPAEEGRVALVSWTPQDGEKELLPKEYNVRTRVHEYGGGALLVTKQNVYFINDKDQQIYCLDSDGNVEKITSRKNSRFADGCMHPKNFSLYYVMEEHGEKTINSIVHIDPQERTVQTVLSGYDFYSNPRISPDGRFLAYISWNLPNMPWDGTELWVLDLKTGERRLVAGGPSISIADPKWALNGTLYYVSDLSGWWNIYNEKNEKPFWTVEGECTLPQWCFGSSLIGFSHDEIICSYVKKGGSDFARISSSEISTPIHLSYTSVKSVTVEDDQMAMIAASLDKPYEIVLLDLKSEKKTIVKRSCSDAIAPDFIARPLSVVFPTTNGEGHGFYYPPTHPEFLGLPKEKPPLIVLAHGGPTSHVSPCFSPEIFYWTSRGFAVIDVNYGGSTGYGRMYREKLKGAWGVVDVDDCINAALYCVKEGLADPNRLAMAGGSAGGFTTLAALAFKKVFQAGIDYFGLSDLERFVLDTHKFESRYLDKLVGPYPEKKTLYQERSPLFHIEKISAPILILQGDEDAIVPPSQSEEMYQSLKSRGIPTAYLLFKGEQHGFRKAENIARALEAELYFFSKIFQFPLDEKIESIFIENLSEEKIMKNNSSQNDKLSPSFEITPVESLIDQDTTIVIKNLNPREIVSVKAEAVDDNGKSWSSCNSFLADKRGVVDLSKQEPLEGTYSGIDSMGLLWSMQSKEGPSASFTGKKDKFSIILKVFRDNREIASQEILRWRKSQEVKRVPVRENGLVGVLFLPPSEKPLPVIVTLSGSSGGIKEELSQLLASHGFAVFALGYFGMEGLPSNLQNFPLEYFEKAFKWIKSQPNLDGSHIGIWGISRGGELSLILGSWFPASIQAIVAVVPSSVIGGQEGDLEGDPLIPAWNYQGKPISPSAPQSPIDLHHIDGKDFDHPANVLHTFLEGMKDKEAFKKAAIPVEKIQASLLLISGGDDQMWPSAFYVSQIEERLQKYHSRIFRESLNYPKAGHGIFQPNIPQPSPKMYHPVYEIWFTMGGSRADNYHACQDSWKKIIAFFDTNLNPKYCHTTIENTTSAETE